MTLMTSDPNFKVIKFLKLNNGKLARLKDNSLKDYFTLIGNCT